MFSIEIKLDLKKDLKNWVDGCNKLSHGKDWKLGTYCRATRWKQF